jgi:hypothetical protein
MSRSRETSKILSSETEVLLESEIGQVPFDFPLRSAVFNEYPIENIINFNYVLPDNKIMITLNNATIESGYTVTVPNGTVWRIL